MVRIEDVLPSRTRFLLFSPWQIRLSSTAASPHTNLCWATGCQHEGCAEQLGLRSANLLLWVKDGIDKLLVREFPTEMLLGGIVRDTEFFSLKTLFPDLGPDMKGGIEIVRHEDMLELRTR